MLEQNTSNAIAPLNMKTIFSETQCNLLLASGSICTIDNFSIAKLIVFNCIQAKWSAKKVFDLKPFSNETVETLGTLKTPFKFNGWQIPRATITVVADIFRHILERD